MVAAGGRAVCGEQDGGGVIALTYAVLMKIRGVLGLVAAVWTSFCASKGSAFTGQPQL